MVAADDRDADPEKRARPVPVRAAQFVRGVVRDARHDDIAGEAAKMAYYFFLSLFPFIVAVFAVTGLLGGNAAFNRITEALRAPVPDFAWQFVRDLIREVTDRRRPGLLSIGVVLTLWAASNGIVALTGGLNAMYDVRDERSWWKRHVIALGVLAAGVTLIVVAAVAFVPGIELVRREGLADEWRVVRWPLAFVLLTATIWLGYYFLPARDQAQARAETLIGATSAVALWALATWVFQLYVANFGRYGRVYGALGAIIVLMIWFYISAFAVLIGGEIAAQLERRRAETARDRDEVRAGHQGPRLVRSAPVGARHSE